jgi:organic hydroperoxide reductase OsmC/OhrA
MLTHAVLRPRVSFSGDKKPNAEEFEQLHARAHRACFIANSVKTEVEVKPAIG